MASKKCAKNLPKRLKTVTTLSPDQNLRRHDLRRARDGRQGRVPGRLRRTADE
jgi:hypothetical protein